VKSGDGFVAAIALLGAGVLALALLLYLGGCA
jgi:hypothetical protein